MLASPFIKGGDATRGGFVQHQLHPAATCSVKTATILTTPSLVSPLKGERKLVLHPSPVTRHRRSTRYRRSLRTLFFISEPLMCVKHNIDTIVACDKKLIQAAAREGLTTVNPD